MKLTNYLPLNRKLQEHWIYKDSDYLHCWLEMLFNARFSQEPKEDVYKGVIYTITRGEFLFSRLTYCERLKIPEGKMRTLLKLLIESKMIELSKSLGMNKPTIYKICNYETYNSQPSEHVENTIVKPNLNLVETKWKPSDNLVATKSQPLKNNVNKETTEESNIIRLVIEHLNAVTGKSYKFNSAKTVSCISARVNEGFKDIDDYKKVIDLKYKQWNGTENEIYIRPETLFGTKFEGYLQTAPREKQNTNWRDGIEVVERIL